MAQKAGAETPQEPKRVAKIIIKRKPTELPLVDIRSKLDTVQEYIRTKKFSEALAALEHLKQVFPRETSNSPYFYIKKMDILLRLGKIFEAGEVGAEALSNKAENVFLLNFYSNVLVESGRTENQKRAIDILQGMLGDSTPAHTPDAYTYVYLAKAYIYTGRYAEAGEVLTQLPDELIRANKQKEKVNAVRTLLEDILHSRYIQGKLTGVTIAGYFDYCRQAEFRQNQSWKNLHLLTSAGVYYFNRGSLGTIRTR